MRFLWIALLMATAAFGDIDATLVGVWTGSGTTIKIEADGKCSVGAETGKCQTLRAALFYQGPNGQVLTFEWSIAGEELTISGNGTNQVFRRASDSPALAPPPPLTTSHKGRWARPQWGVEFSLPPGWNAVEREGTVLLGSDKEAGLMLVRFAPGMDRQKLAAAYGQGLLEDGVRLMPATRIEEFTSGSLRGIAGELGGFAPNGARLSARVIGILTPFGDAAIFLGVTTVEQYRQLRPRVDMLAASAAFTRPALPPANATVAGRYAYILVSTSGDSYSRQDTITLCSNGTFERGSEMAGVSRPSTGRWSADGDGQSGILTLQYSGGTTEQLRYLKSGPDIVLNGKKYGRLGDGNCGR